MEKKLIKDYIKIQSVINNPSYKKLIEHNSYMIKQQNDCLFAKYDIYVNDSIVGIVNSNPVILFHFESINKDYKEIKIFADNFNYGQWHG